VCDRERERKTERERKRERERGKEREGWLFHTFPEFFQLIFKNYVLVLFFLLHRAICFFEM
jgi:hypothetical protein